MSKRVYIVRSRHSVPESKDHVSPIAQFGSEAMAVSVARAWEPAPGLRNCYPDVHAEIIVQETLDGWQL